MNLKTMAEDWMLDHGYDEEDSSWSQDVEDLRLLLEEVLCAEKYIALTDEGEYDPTYGDNKECLCGHSYYRHFDTYDDMAAVGCKYCSKWTMSETGEQHSNRVCTGFKEKPIVQSTYQPVATIPEPETNYCIQRVGCTCDYCTGWGAYKG